MCTILLQRNVLSFAHCYHSTNCSECQMAFLGGARAVMHVTPSRKMDLFSSSFVVSVSYLVFLNSRGLLNNGCDVIMT